MKAPGEVIFSRGELPESVHRVHVAVVNAAGQLVASCGDAALVMFPRSSSKPFQAIPLAEAAPDLSSDELAIACASHAGTQRHLSVVERLLRRAGLDESALQCGTHAPFDPDAQAQLVRTGTPPSTLHHNCSGKHAGMLLTCRLRGLDLTSYTAAQHPLQREIAALHAALGAVDEVRVGRDGCSVPALALPLEAGARLFARLAAPEGPHEAALERVFAAMTLHPELIAGTRRLDTELMPRVPGCASKMGAEGYFGLALRDTPQGPLGVAIKIEDGSERARAHATLAVLNALGVPFSPELADLYPAALHNFAGYPVGEVQTEIHLA
ncbi:asparaginase [Deinococcus peraridilitoris]|uniref:L-asparaginase II n=1 Tax=Deinococcus peraridilitoris (strain DSM 19664 / LMG 22246 / CIP 109416 / KR-200) TaxID=937777 RepID=L0A565_DEIPD|nr:asparaginase [Deinococcus peraridilitoris]AFZ68130.1 L-asparaginase II [Deinococcus peraridilitoris DSM 19664]